MKTNIFIPLAMEYDYGTENWEASFGVTAKDQLDLMLAIARKHREAPEDAYVTNILMDSIKEMSPGMLLYLASKGAWQMWKKHAKTAVLTVDAEIEAKKAAQG